MKKTVSLLIIMSFFLTANAQKLKEGIEFKYNVEAIKGYPILTWYGWDFSNVKMRDFKKFDEGDIIVGKHLPSIIGKLTITYPEARIKRATKVDSVVVDRETINMLYQSIDRKSFVTMNTYELKPEAIQEIVKKYTLPQKSGLGLVVIMEMMNDEKDPFRYASGYVTFFDIESREVYYTTKMKGLPGSKWGFEDYWFNGITEIFDYFFAKYYSKTMKGLL